jgi:hypothetical protein
MKSAASAAQVWSLVLTLAALGDAQMSASIALTPIIMWRQVAVARVAAALLVLTAMVPMSVRAVADAAPIPAKPGVVDDAFWHLRSSLDAGPDTVQFIYGRMGDRPLMGDWDGNATATAGVVRRAPDGVHLRWLLRNTNSGGAAQIAFLYGLAGDPAIPAYYDFPIVGDWDGNGTDTAGVVRVQPQRLTFLLRNSNTSGSAQISFSYGRFGTPVVGDWDGNGIDTPGVVRDDGLDPGNEQWLLRNSNTGGRADISFVYGRGGDFPIRGDWNGDGKDTAGVVRFVPAGLQSQWLLRNSNTSGPADVNFIYGRGDRPVVVWR